MESIFWQIVEKHMPFCDQLYAVCNSKNNCLKKLIKKLFFIIKKGTCLEVMIPSLNDLTGILNI